MYGTVKKYISAFSVSGNEHALAEIISADIAPYCDSVEIDPMGNVIAFKKGADSSKRLTWRPCGDGERVPCQA